MSSVLRGVNTALSAVGIESSKVQSLGGAPNVDPLGETYYSVKPFRYGDYIAKFAVFQVSSDLKSCTTKVVEVGDNPDAIRQHVEGEMKVIDGDWELRVQLCRDLEKQPVEDPTVEWKGDDTPFQTVATIRVGRQESWADAQVQKVNEEMRFSPWLGLASHQPLGDINGHGRRRMSTRWSIARNLTVAQSTNLARRTPPDGGYSSTKTSLATVSAQG